MNISAISGTKITAYKNNSFKGNMHVNKSEKADTVTVAGKEIKKKTAVAGFLAAAAVIGAGIIYAVRKGKAPLEAKEMMQRANEFSENAHKTVNEVMELFQNGGKNSEGKMVAQITHSKDSDVLKFMNEFAQDGTTPVRKSTFINDMLCRVEEFTSDNKQNTAFLQNNKLTIYREGEETLPDGIYKTAKEAYFENNKPYLYTEGIEIYHTDNNSRVYKTAKEVCISEKGKPLSYKENLISDDSDIKSGKWTAYMNNRWMDLTKKS